MSVITDLLAARREETQASLLGLLQGMAAQRAAERAAASTTGPGTVVSGDSTGTTHLPEGEAKYRYTTYDKPYWDYPQNMRTARGITLQRGPMRSLMQIARESDILPGTREVGKILTGYREPHITSAMSAPAGMSWHSQGLAIDAGWWSQQPELAAALSAAGWNRFDPKIEPWHWSYGVTG